MSQFNDNNYYGGGGGGGGYVAGSPYGGASESPGGANRRSEASTSIRPLTCKQVMGATQAHTDAEWMIDDLEIGQITVIGQVVSINRQTTNCIYWIDDGTARIESRHWAATDNESEMKKWSGIAETQYARVTGQLKTFGNKRYINAQHLRPCPNYEEIITHLFQVMTTNRILEKGLPLGPGNSHQTGGQPGASAYASNATAASSDQYSHLPELQRTIIDAIIQQSTDTNGVHVAVIARIAGGDAALIGNALDKLMDDGLIFTTIDDSHFSAAI